MFLHIGGDEVVPLRELVAIINASNKSPLNDAFLATAQEEGFVVQLTSEPISYVLTEKRVYLSPISSSTLKKRAAISFNRGEVHHG